jgi:hypothetical protein
MTTIKTRRKMGWVSMAFHTTMLICTCGLWTPIWLAARRRRVTITHIPTGYQGPIPGQPYAPPPPQPYGPPQQHPAPPPQRTTWGTNWQPPTR